MTISRNEVLGTKCGPVARREKHMEAFSAMVQLNSSIDRLSDLTTKIAHGNAERGDNCKQPEPDMPSLRDYLDGSPDAIITASDRIGALVDEITSALF